MQNTSGFYKYENGEWLYAPNFVFHRDYTLMRDGNRESIDGWQWYDTSPIVSEEIETKLMDLGEQLKKNLAGIEFSPELESALRQIYPQW